MPTSTALSNTNRIFLLISYTIEMLKKNGIKNISIVTGYKHKEIEAEIAQHDIDIYYNPFYELVNSIGSLWFCAHKIQTDDDILILNADTFLEESFYETILKTAVSDTHPVLFIDSSRKDQADVKVTYCDTGNKTGSKIGNNTTNHNTILELDLYGKTIAAESMAESLDVAILPKSYTSDFFQRLLEMMEQKLFDTWWESVLVDYKDKTSVVVQDICGMFWSEIDFYEDYQRILDFISQ